MNTSHSHSPIQIVNEHDEPVGTASIQETQEKGLIHQMARVMVEDTDGQVLLQKRDGSKHLYPNCWDNSAAGHVDAGESYLQAAKRELAEEIGLKDIELKEIGHYRHIGNYKDLKLNRFTHVYKAVVPPGQQFILEPGAVTEVKWFSREQFQDLITKQPNQITDGVLDVFDRYYS